MDCTLDAKLEATACGDMKPEAQAGGMGVCVPVAERWWYPLLWFSFPSAMDEWSIIAVGVW
jgi:hypothetical protein